MATARPRRRKPAKAAIIEDNPLGDPTTEQLTTIDDMGLETTGRSIVTFQRDTPAALKKSLAAMKTSAGVSKVSRMADFKKQAFTFEATAGADAVVLDELGVAIVTSDGDRSMALSAMETEGSAGVIVEPEYINYALDEVLDLDEDILEGGDDADDPQDFEGAPTGSNEFLRGYQQAVQQLVAALGGAGSAEGLSGAELSAGAEVAASASATWGLHATRVLRSSSTGRGIRVAVLDTGFDLRHPDFVGRSVTSQSFVAGETVQDRNGHGTHCIGTACGPRRPGRGPRYGVAWEAEIFAGKVLSNAGRGSDGGILAGINWALQNGCHVISMSLGRPTRVGERPMRAYEIAGGRALRAGTLIVAAAGNESNRPRLISPVGSPANARPIVAVAALDSRLRVARFSNRGINPMGGEINLAGPGVQIHSSWPMPLRYRTISGTSMATPHVAGLAALVAQEGRAFRGVALYRELRRRARRLRLRRADVGNGLAEAV